MEDFWNQGWFVMRLAWDRARYEVANNITLVVTVATILLFLWIFLSPMVRKKGN